MSPQVRVLGFRAEADESWKLQRLLRKAEKAATKTGLDGLRSSFRDLSKPRTLQGFGHAWNSILVEFRKP